MSPSNTFLFCGGGSGGHLFPALAVVEELRQRFADNCHIQFLTTGRDIEHQILSEGAVEQISLGTVSSTTLLKTPLRSIARLLSSIRQAREILRESKPRVVIGLGGFGSVPGIWAAKSLGLPIVLLEQNAIAGRANSWLSRWADLVCISFPDTGRLKCRRTVLTGNPIRRSILQAVSQRQERSRKLLILGGSQGAEALNTAMISILGALKAALHDWEIVHQTGSSDVDRVSAAYQSHGMSADVRSFIADIAPVLASSELVISRAGATTLAELAVMGLPAILVPIPNSVRNHQYLNAERLEQAGAAFIVEQDSDTTSFHVHLESGLTKLIADSGRRQQMQASMLELAQPAAVERVVHEVLNLADLKS